MLRFTATRRRLRLRLIFRHHGARFDPAFHQRNVSIRNFRPRRRGHRHRIVSRALMAHQSHQQRFLRIARHQHGSVMSTLQHPRVRRHAQTAAMIHPAVAAKAVRRKYRLDPGRVKLRTGSVFLSSDRTYTPPRCNAKHHSSRYNDDSPRTEPCPGTHNQRVNEPRPSPTQNLSQPLL